MKLEKDWEKKYENEQNSENEQNLGKVKKIEQNLKKS